VINHDKITLPLLFAVLLSCYFRSFRALLPEHHCRYCDVTTILSVVIITSSTSPSLLLSRKHFYRTSTHCIPYHGSGFRTTYQRHLDNNFATSGSVRQWIVEHIGQRRLESLGHHRYRCSHCYCSRLSSAHRHRSSSIRAKKVHGNAPRYPIGWAWI
jgi:hypothetical protein